VATFFKVLQESLANFVTSHHCFEFSMRASKGLKARMFSKKPLKAD